MHQVLSAGGNQPEILEKRKESQGSILEQDWEARNGRELVDIVTRHRALIRLTGDIEAMFSFGLLINFMYSSIILCFSGFCVVTIEKWNEWAYKVFLPTTLSQTWMLCWYGQQLLDSSVGIGGR
uniref:Odorant receptor 4-like n=1 Tax=Eudocima materna TaxID=1123336 RepID=A0A8T9KQY9_9NEOP|nr:odorant receptor 4-like [Eudocima materna]